MPRKMPELGNFNASRKGMMFSPKIRGWEDCTSLPKDMIRTAVKAGLVTGDTFTMRYHGYGGSEVWQLVAGHLEAGYSLKSM